MARQTLPPRYVNIPAGPAYDPGLPDGVFRTYVQLRGLAWGKDRLDEITVKEIVEATGKSRSTIYGHLGILRDRGWLLFNAAHYSWLTVEFCGSGPDGGKDNNRSVDNPVDKSVDNLSRNLDCLNEEVKDLTLNPEINLPPPDVHVNPREEVVRISGQAVQKSGQEGVETQRTRSRGKNSLTPLPPSREGVDAGSREGVGSERNNGWHDVIAPDLERKLARLGVFAPVYGQVADGVRSGEWSVEQVHRLADQVIGERAGAGVFVYRFQNRIRPESPGEKQKKAVERFREVYRERGIGSRE